MTGGRGPYIEIDGPNVWVPRTVPYREAWGVAREAVTQYGEHVTYRGKDDAYLTGFARACDCDEECELRFDEDAANNGEDDACRVPAWHFEIVEDRR